MINDEVMDVKTLRAILSEIHNKVENYEIWLSKDEEGNEFQRMCRNTEISLVIDNKHNRLIFFPSWCWPNKKDIPHDY
ncbi:MAG: hypothetical protein OEV87_09575 [Phycisphaerae bacterium]|nr:hypothetical protein [Phycisphaerae bacterium]